MTPPPCSGPLRATVVALGVLAAGSGLPETGTAQQPADSSALARARALTAEGDHRSAADLLAGYLERHPDQARVRWLYARVLYWSGRPGPSRRQYEHALSALDDLPALRLDFARFLLENGDPARAREVLGPLVGPGVGPSDRAEARELRGRAARATAPRLSLEAVYVDDNQPLRSAALVLEGGVPLSPGVLATVEGRGYRLDGGGAAPSLAAVRAGLEVVGQGPVSVRAEAGRLRHGGGVRSAWVGEAALDLELGAGFTLNGSAERWNYRHTATSLDTAVMVETAAARLRRERPTGWGGALGGRVDRFPDGNRVRAAYLWILAPIWSTGGDALRMGYAFRAADADRTTLRATAAGGDGGVYDPYYTPEEVHSHSAIAALQLRPSRGLLLALDGALGIHASRRIPADGARPGRPTGTAFVADEYRPWRVGGRVRAETSPSDAVELQAGYRRDDFFRIVEASLRWTHWFTGTVPGR